MLLAQTDPAASGGGPWGLLIIVILAVVTIFLIRNMSARLKRMPRSFGPPPEKGDETDDPRSDDPR